MWQDFVIAIANVLFSYALIVQVTHGFRKKKTTLTLQTSSLNTIGLYAMSIAMFSLGLYLSFVAMAFSATMWLVLFIQRIIYQ